MLSITRNHPYSTAATLTKLAAALAVQNFIHFLRHAVRHRRFTSGSYNLSLTSGPPEANLGSRCAPGFRRSF